MRIIAIRGASKKVIHESWVCSVAKAIYVLFDVQCFYNDRYHRDYLAWTFCGISQNTRAVATAFEYVHNLICVWGVGKGKSKTSFCIDVSDGFEAIAKSTKDDETVEMIKRDQDALKARVAWEETEEQTRLDRIQIPASSVQTWKSSRTKSRVTQTPMFR